MKVGIRFQESEPQLLADIAVAAEELGFESLWRGEHLVIPRVIRSVDPYYARALAPGIESFPVHDAAIVYAFVAARTTRIRLGLGALLLPLRHPVEAARMLTTLDVMTAGRVTVAVGLGWLREEFDALDQPWSGRGPRTEEAIAVMRTLWSDRHPEFHGVFYDLPPVMFEPKPVQAPHPPILIAGISAAALDRAARIGDGWYGHDLSPAQARRCVQSIEDRRTVHGRGDAAFEFTGRTHAHASRAEVEALFDAGLNRVVFDVGAVRRHGRDGVFANLERVARDVLAHL